MADPRVRREINRRVTGDPDTWPIEWLAQAHLRQPLATAVIPGCGTGSLERDLLGKRLVERVLAFDISPAQIDTAKKLAQPLGWTSRIEYEIASIDEFDFTRVAVTACFFHHAIHHTRDPGRVLARIAAALPSGSLVYFDEYVGPTRYQWNSKTFDVAIRAYRDLPESVRRHSSLRIPGWLARLADPSESPASDRILDAAYRELSVVDRRDYGGFVLQPLWGQFHPDDDTVERLIQIENELASKHPTWFTVLVARVP